jgi:hypothetical protein
VIKGTFNTLAALVFEMLVYKKLESRAIKKVCDQGLSIPKLRHRRAMIAISVQSKEYFGLIIDVKRIKKLEISR